MQSHYLLRDWNLWAAESRGQLREEWGHTSLHSQALTLSLTDRRNGHQCRAPGRGGKVSPQASLLSLRLDGIRESGQVTWELTGLPTSYHQASFMASRGNKSSSLHENSKPSSYIKTKQQKQPTYRVYSMGHEFPPVKHPSDPLRSVADASPPSHAHYSTVSTSCLASQYCSMQCHSTAAVPKTTNVFFLTNQMPVWNLLEL